MLRAAGGTHRCPILASSGNVGQYPQLEKKAGDGGVLPCARPEPGAGIISIPGAEVKAARGWGETGPREATRPGSGK